MMAKPFFSATKLEGGLMTEALGRLADEDRRYSSARKRALAALRSTRSLGTQGRRSWSRDELHDR